MAKLVKNLARLHYSRINDAVVDIEPGTARDNKAVVAHKRKMLRKVRFGKLGYPQEIFD